MGKRTVVGRPFAKFGDWVQDKTDDLGQSVKDLFKAPKVGVPPGPGAPPDAADEAARAAAQAERDRPSARRRSFLTGAGGASGAARVRPPASLLGR